MLFSVVMPCYNVADTIDRTLDAICRQTFTDFELVAVDDGSTDETAAIVETRARECLPQPAEVRVISQTNGGPGAARNHGMRVARGDLIAFLDADDIWKPEYLEDVAAAFSGLPQADAMACNSWDWYSDGYHLNVASGGGEAFAVDDFFRALSDKTVVLRTSAITLRRSVIEQVGYMREDLLRSQDGEYWARIGASGVTWGFLPRPLMIYDGLRMQSVSRNESRFVKVPSPERWSQKIWPLVDPSTHDGFLAWYVRRAKNLCRECLQAGLDGQARTTAAEALTRTKRPRDTVHFLAVRYLPGWLYRAVQPLGSRVKTLARALRGGSRAQTKVQD